MSQNRFFAVQQAGLRKPVEPETGTNLKSKVFGSKVFGRDAMREYITRETFNAEVSAIESGVSIDMRIAGEVSTAIKTCAL